MTRRAVPRDLVGATAATTLATSEIVYDAKNMVGRLGDGATAGGMPFPADYTLYPEPFMLGSDAGDGIAFQRMFDAASAKENVLIGLRGNLYNISDEAITVSSPVQVRGAGFIESGSEAGFRAGAYSEPLVGTRIVSNYLGGPQITIAGGNTRGTSWDGLLFFQSHPTPGTGWAPTAYDYLLDIESTLGGAIIGRVALQGINKGLRCVNSGRLTIENLTGQCYTNGIYVDEAYDVPRLDHAHFYSFASADPNVLAYQQANLDVLTLGRCDGFFGGKLFAIYANKGFRFINAGVGVTTKMQWDSAYLDFVRYGVCGEADAVDAAIDNLQVTGEQVGTNGGALPNSAGLYVPGNGGDYDIGTFRSDRIAAAAVQNTGNSTISIDRPRWQYLNGAPPIINSGAGQVLLGRREITDGSGAALNEAVVLREINNRDFALGSYANDAAAASNGVAIGAPYFEASTGYAKKRLS